LCIWYRFGLVEVMTARFGVHADFKLTVRVRDPSMTDLGYISYFGADTFVVLVSQRYRGCSMYVL
jgi:hypothetical protein